MFLHPHDLSEVVAPQVMQMSQVTFGGGCFWCTEAIFQQIRGVSHVESGYSGGHTVCPTYEEVCTGRTGHEEVIQVTYDPLLVTYGQLIRVHLGTHNPTTLNQQGADRGTQYRSIIFYETVAERQAAEQLVQEVQNASGKQVVTEIRPLLAFYAAESEHQNYYRLHEGKPYCEAVIDPKLSKFRMMFTELLRS